MPAAEAGGGKGKKRAGQGATIHVLAEGKLQPVNVRLGITDGRNTEVLGGEPASLLQPGARVVVGENASGGKAPSSVGMRLF